MKYSPSERQLKTMPNILAFMFSQYLTERWKAFNKLQSIVDFVSYDEDIQ